MSKITLLILCSLLVCAAECEQVEDVDVFQVLVNFENSYRETNDELNKINYWLVDQTESTDPQENLDIILESLIMDLKKQKPSDKMSANGKAKRLLLSLGALNDENMCTKFGYIVLKANYIAGGRKAKQALDSDVSRRIDKILVHYMKEHVRCSEIYPSRFENILSGMDKTKVGRVNKFFEKAIEHLTSDIYVENRGKDYVERLSNIAKRRLLSLSTYESDYIWRTLREVVKGDPDARFAEKVEDEKTGKGLRLRRNKFDRLFNDYLLEPCEYYREKLGPEVFEPLQFDAIVPHDIRKYKTDFYKAWLNYKLCEFDDIIEVVLERVVRYVDWQTGPTNKMGPPKYLGTYNLKTDH